MPAYSFVSTNCRGENVRMPKLDVLMPATLVACFLLRDPLWECAKDFSPFFLHTFGSLVVHLCVFWPVCLLFMLLDLTQKPESLYKYKIQPAKDANWQTYKSVIRIALINQFVVALPFSIVVHVVTSMLGLRSGTCVDELPSYTTIMRDLLGFVLVEEFGFFYSHYYFHVNKSLYKRVHKFHHKLTAPVAMGCIYAHPVEHIVANVSPLLLGPLIMQSHITTEIIWFTLGIINTMYVHSGYAWPLFPDSKKHDYHHEAFNYNYGTFGLLDWLHGTAGQSKRDKIE